MSTPNWIFIRENQNVTYIVNKYFNYYIAMSAGSTVTFKAQNPNNEIILTKNIWGPGNLTFGGGNVRMEADIGCAPAKTMLTPNCFTYAPDVVTEVIA